MLSQLEFEEKLGNGLRLILQSFGPTSKTSILKLLYLIDEKSVQKAGRPVFNLDYQVWQHGPVDPSIFVQLSDMSESLSPYVELKNQTFHSVGDFNDDEFSEYEINIITSVCQSLRNKKAFELVDKTHRQNGLWHQIALRNDLLNPVTNTLKTPTSSVRIDLSELVEADPFLKSRYKDYIETLMA